MTTGVSSLEHRAPAGTRIWYYQSYDGQVGPSGQKYCTVKSLRPGEEWPEYQVVVQFPDGTVKQKKVLLSYGKKTIIDWVAA